MEVGNSYPKDTYQFIPTSDSRLHCDKHISSWLNQISEGTHEQVDDWRSTVHLNLLSDKGYDLSSDRMHSSGRMPSRRGGTKRTRQEMESTNSLDSTFSMTSRSILLPRSTSRASIPTGSSSPSRDVLDALRTASPSVQCVGQDAQMNQKAMEVRRHLSQNFGDPIIPFKLKVCKYRSLEHRARLTDSPSQEKLRTVDPISVEEISESAFNYNDKSSDADLERLWATVQRIHLEAHDCAKNYQDENAWCEEVVQRVLSWGESTSGDDFLKLKSLQTQRIDNECLPMSIENTEIDTKIDYALAYSPRDPATKALYSKLDRRGFSSRSQMTYIHTKHLAFAAGVAVKRAYGNDQEALAQFSIWAAAGFVRLHELQILKESIQQRISQQELSLAHPSQDSSSQNFSNDVGSKESSSDFLPVIGWTIVGHDWHFHMAYEFTIENQRSIRVMGRLKKLTADTESYLGIFRLLDLVTRVKDWSRDVHWPWLSKEILEPLLLD